MAILAGEPKFLKQCAPGDLIRLPHNGTSAWALASRTENAPADTDLCLYVTFNPTDGCMVHHVEAGDVACLSFSRLYRVEMRCDDAASLVVGGTFVLGAIVCYVPRDGTASKSFLMCRNLQGQAKWLDLEAGLLRAQPNGDTLNILAWDLALVEPEKSGRVVHRHVQAPS